MGFQQFQRTVQANDDRNSGKGGGFTRFTPEIKFQKGIAKKLRFNGSGDEPLAIATHSHKSVDDHGNERFATYICAKQFVGETDPNDPMVGEFASWMGGKAHEGCVLCIQKSHGDKSIGGSSTRMVCSTLDEGLYHKVPNAQGAANSHGTVYVNDEPCTGTGCKHCKSTGMAKVWDRKAEKITPVPIRDRHRGGQFKWRISSTSASALWNQIIEIRKFCACCWPKNAAEGAGLIDTLELKCPSCEAPIDLDAYDYTTSVKHTCAACGESNEPTETAQCSNGCEGARRATMFDGSWKVTKNGEKTATTHTFQFLGVSELPDWTFDYEAPDLTKEELPFSAAKMAEKLGVVNPFGRGGGVAPRSPAPSRGRAPAGGNRGRAPVTDEFPGGDAYDDIPF